MGIWCTWRQLTDLQFSNKYYSKFSGKSGAEERVIVVLHNEMWIKKSVAIGQNNSGSKIIVSQSG